MTRPSFKVNCSNKAHPGHPFSNVDFKSMLREVLQEELKGISDVSSVIGKPGKGPATVAG